MFKMDVLRYYFAISDKSMMGPPLPPPDPTSIDVERHEFERPQRAVKLMKDMPLWEKSQAHADFLNFILSLNDAVRGKCLSTQCHVSENTQNLIDVLNKLFDIIKDCPPIDQPQRFGNQAFRTWFTTVKDKSTELLKMALPVKYHTAIREVVVYFEDSFGNSTRIDYGTGHEASFIMFLYCLFKIGALSSKDKEAAVCLVFYKYLELVRTLQQTYKMEPAGSHGVWSLDDFQFVPFIWGSSQLIGHSVIEPHKYLEEEILSKYGKDYMFLSCIQYIQQVKTGPFAEHSNQLWGISAVPNWLKINNGLIRMYTKEVLGKFPVVQHFIFGSLLSIKSADPSTRCRI